MTLDEIKTDVRIKVGDALIELEKDTPDMEWVREHLCDAAQMTYFKEDGSRTDELSYHGTALPDKVG